MIIKGRVFSKGLSNVSEKRHPWKMERSVLGGLSKNRGEKIAW